MSVLRPRIARHTASPRPADGLAGMAPRARGSAEQTTQTLLASARQVFGQKGYVRTTVQDIIEGTGLSRGAFYRYFGSTDEIFIAMVTGVVDELIVSSRERSGCTLRERVFGGNLRYLQIFARHRGVMRALFEAAYVNPQIAEIQGRMRSAYLRRLRDHLLRQLQLGRCQPIDADAATLALGMMVEGAAQAWVVMGLEPFEQALDLERLCTQVTEIWCRAVYLEPDQPLPEPEPAATVPSDSQGQQSGEFDAPEDGR
jgi:AcrR family transcriptional regulator